MPFPSASLIQLPIRGGAAPLRLSTHQLGAGPAVVFCHGFPDLAYGWRHQLGPVAEAGFHAIAPDQRGYGGSSAPREVEAYGLSELTGDLVGLLDALEIERAYFVGHDWGGFVAWGMPVLHPDRVLGVACLCTPYMPLGTAEDLDHYCRVFERTGFIASPCAPGTPSQSGLRTVSKPCSDTRSCRVVSRPMFDRRRHARGIRRAIAFRRGFRWDTCVHSPPEDICD
jgi:pimeloyl-ACP methyl ester carboxylesterase